MGRNGLPGNELPEAMRSIRLIALDVDGVLTQGDIIYTSSGDEIKIFNAKDGLGISLAIRNGLMIAIITARQSSIVDRRAEELGITHVRQGAKNKRQALEALMEELSLTPEQVAYMGDDLPDIPALELAGLACCPQDAAQEVINVCQWVSGRNGGRGAVRELVDKLLAARP
ncbi:MAG: HAD-IIIA family hydrolase [Vampirovibrionales bacterium]|nr:HAD-IIIA family hydrolase [Vampirovibrionales bacterium]